MQFVGMNISPSMLMLCKPMRSSRTLWSAVFKWVRVGQWSHLQVGGVFLHCRVINAFGHFLLARPDDCVVPHGRCMHGQGRPPCSPCMCTLPWVPWSVTCKTMARILRNRERRTSNDSYIGSLLAELARCVCHLAVCAPPY